MMAVQTTTGVTGSDMDVLQQISESLQRGEHEKVAGLTQQAIDAGTSAAEILNQGLLAGMDVVGRRFGAHEIFLPEVLLSARAMNAGVDLLKPLLIAEEVPSLGKVVIGTVKGDLHDIGKNLVGIMLEGAGGATVVGLSALLTTTMTGMKDVVELVRSRGLQGKLKVIVGGAPLSRSFADDIGADAYGFDAANAVERIRELTGG